MDHKIKVNLTRIEQNLVPIQKLLYLWQLNNIYERTK